MRYERPEWEVADLEDLDAEDMERELIADPGLNDDDVETILAMDPEEDG